MSNSWWTEQLRRASLHGMLLGALLAVSGCKIGQTAASIDSDSGVPSFGMSLIPKQSEPPIPDSAPRVPPRVLAEKDQSASTRQVSAVEDDEEIEDDADDSDDEPAARSKSNPLTRWLLPGKGERKRIALPRTDLDDEEE